MPCRTPRALSRFLLFGAVLVSAVLCPARDACAWNTNDWQFLDQIERVNLKFFQEQKRGPYALLNDTAYYDSVNNYPAYASVAGTGFELTSICLGHYRGWISFSNAYEQVLKQLRLFTGSLSTNPLVGERVNGWTFHTYWIEDSGTNKAGTRYYMDDGLSMLDHSLFMGGCIFVSEYFKGTEAGDLAHKIYNETTWSWRPNGDYNFGYSENLLAIIESAAAPQFSKGSEARTMWNDYINPPWPRTLQLYFWQYPHSWIDFRFRSDGDGVNHSDVARDSILYQRQRAIDLHNSDPVKYDMIGTNCWGWTAAGASDGYRQMAPWDLWLGRHYPVEEASDSGSITPIGLPGCMIYAGTETMACMKHIFEQYYINGWDPGVGEKPVWSTVYGWLNGLNEGRPWRYYSDSGVSNHYHGINAGIDYGPNVLLLENYKMGTTWRYFMQNPYISAGMYTVGFGDPQQVTASTFEGSSNHFGGGIGHWENDATPVTAGYVNADWTNAYVTGKVVRFVADNSNEGGWIDLNSADMRAKALLTFWVKCHGGAEGIDIGLKDDFGNENKVRLNDFAGGAAPTNWTQVKIPLEHFALTPVLTNDTWLADLALVSFAFTNAGGGTIDIDYLAFTNDTLAPVRPTNAFGCAMAGNHARVAWDPVGAERDVVGYHVWRRLNATDGFTRVTAQLVPAYRGVWEDTNVAFHSGQEVRYAIQAYDNGQPANSSPFAHELTVEGGRLDIDWNNGRNPNLLAGTADGYWGGATAPPAFLHTNGPGGGLRWVRQSSVTDAGAGQFIDLAGADLTDYWALSFHVRGTNGGEQIDIGLRDSTNGERKVHLDDFLAAGSVSTGWALAIIPLAEFTNVNLSSLSNLSITHAAAGEVLLAEIAFIEGQRADLMNEYFTECEDYTRQFGTTTQDFKAAASGGEVLGWGWGADGGDYADYEFYLVQALTDMTVHVRYSCDANTGRTFDVRWDDAWRGFITCTNTGGWGETNDDFSWATAAIGSSATAGRHKLTFYANGLAVPVNLDLWQISYAGSCRRECEDYDTQSGSLGEDLKAGASAGEVLGDYWGASSNDYAAYSDVDAGTHTSAWLHLWYACAVSSGRVVKVFLDGAYTARLICPRTRGWGNAASELDRVSAWLGPLASGGHTVQFRTEGDGDGINLDCFYVGPTGPEGLPLDADGDGLGDRQEAAAGTSSASTDSDGDGIDDGEEGQAGLSGQVSNPAKADSDDDGHDDGEEQTAGTDPNNPDSIFQWLEISAQDFPMIGRIFRWPSATGRYYTIAVSSNLLTSDFCPLTSGLSATPPQNAWTDTVERAPAAIFRIDVKRTP